MAKPSWTPWRFLVRPLDPISCRSDKVLEARITDLIEIVFAPEDQPRAREMINKLVIPQSDGRHYRCKIAAIKCSNGEIDRLAHAIDQARIDFRDLLMAADFGHDTSAHLHWTPERR